MVFLEIIIFVFIAATLGWLVDEVILLRNDLNRRSEMLYETIDITTQWRWYNILGLLETAKIIHCVPNTKLNDDD
jgi:hypothetical protein